MSDKLGMKKKKKKNDSKELKAIENVKSTHTFVKMKYTYYMFIN